MASEADTQRPFPSQYSGYDDGSHGLDISAVDSFVTLFNGMVFRSFPTVDILTEGPLSQLSIRPCGKNATEDAYYKNRFLDGLYPHGLPPRISFQDLESHPSLQEFWNSNSFRVSRSMYTRDLPLTLTEVRATKEHASYGWHWSSQMSTLQASAEEAFGWKPTEDAAYEVRVMPSPSDYMRVKRTAGFSINDARSFAMKTYNVTYQSESRYEFETSINFFKLFAVVRLGCRETTDQVRFYNRDNLEVKSRFGPEEVIGSVRVPEGWTTSDAAEYMLIYARSWIIRDGQRIPDNYPGSADAPEYSSKDCNGKDVLSSRMNTRTVVEGVLPGTSGPTPSSPPQVSRPSPEARTSSPAPSSSDEYIPFIDIPEWGSADCLPSCIRSLVLRALTSIPDMVSWLGDMDNRAPPTYPEPHGRYHDAGWQVVDIMKKVRVAEIHGDKFTSAEEYVTEMRFLDALAEELYLNTKDPAYAILLSRL